ncbi:Uncharacterised protein [Raoultella terrigena]|uniref:HPr domain-containing protein n=1 Tax=Raoultella terrigena TaxID=577 RepID=A0A3P8IX96_RAOTE|nr:Uncharacterised protein [Raoultella terrigena]
MRSGIAANGKSALAIVATDTLFNDACEITLIGKDAPAAAQRLGALLKKLPSFEVSQAEEAPASTGYLPRSLRGNPSPGLFKVHALAAVSPLPNRCAFRACH